MIITLFFSLGVTCSCFGQKEHNVWHFGCEAGITFNTSTPVGIPSGMICTNEGCSSICDSDGQLLFYTDGANIWNRNHEIMPNGSELSGGWTSTQAALIVKKPEHVDKYYVFTTANQAQVSGLRYSVVNMSLGCGLGAVGEIKDSLIEPFVCEKLTAVLHQNKRDYWIVTHKYGSNDFHSYLLSPSGLDLNPVVTSIGQNIDFQSYTGHLKSSNSGDKIAAAFGNGPVYPLQLFDFDRSTGQLSNEMSLGSLEDPDYGNYGIEFSPYDRFLYVSENSGTPNGNNIYQFDLLAGTSSAINNSRTVIWTFPATQGEPGALQLGPDGKIYLAVWTRSALSIIEYPDSLGSATSFIEDGISLGGATSLGGLPSKPNSFGHPYIEASNFCFGVTSYFSVIAQTEIDSVNWSFGDPSTGAANFSNSFDSQHVFSQPGIFEIQLILY
jgi:hypothetical protein